MLLLYAEVKALALEMPVLTTAHGIAAQTVEEITTDFQTRLLAKQQRIAAEESLGDGKDPVRLRAMKQEILCPAPQSSGFDIEAMPG
jgi:hypothetical protein